MKTELIHSYSAVSLSRLGLSRSPSQASFNKSNDGGKDSQILTSEVNGKFINVDKNDKRCEKPKFCQGYQTWKESNFRKNLSRKVPIFNWLPKYNGRKAFCDIIAGITVGLTIVPQALAYAELAGLPPQYGLYSAFIGCFVYIFVGSTTAVNIGPTASLAMMTLSYGAGKPPEYTIILTLLTGLVILAMGLLQLGFIVNFISTPVMSAFTSAVAITIISTQIKSLLGLNFHVHGLMDVVEGLWHTIHKTQIHDLILGVVCISALIFLKNLQAIFKSSSSCPKIVDKTFWLLSTSRSAVLVVCCTALYAACGDPPPVRVVGDIISGLPEFRIPKFEFGANGTNPGEFISYTFGSVVKESSSALIVLPIISVMEHITIAKAASSSRVDATQEMVAIGLSNLIGSFFGSIPVTGSFSRTMVNRASGVESPLGGFVTGVMILLALQFLTPYFYYIPKAALASVIVCAVASTIEVAIVKVIWKTKRMDVIPWAVTFVISVTLGLEFGILAGLLISLLFLLYYAARPGVRVKQGETSTGVQFLLVEVDRSLIFPSVDYTSYVVMKSGTNWGKNRLPVVIDCQYIQFADFTAAEGMKEIFMSFNAKNQELILWRAKPSVLRIINGAMQHCKTPFKFCTTEAELEALLEERRNELEKDNTGIQITFTMDDDDDSSQNSLKSEEEEPELSPLDPHIQAEEECCQKLENSPRTLQLLQVTWQP